MKGKGLITFYKQNVLKVKHWEEYIVLQIKGMYFNYEKNTFFAEFLSISYQICCAVVPSSDWIMVEYWTDTSCSAVFYSAHAVRVYFCFPYLDKQSEIFNFSTSQS